MKCVLQLITFSLPLAEYLIYPLVMACSRSDEQNQQKKKKQADSKESRALQWNVKKTATV